MRPVHAVAPIAIACLLSTAVPVLADCKDEVLAALEKQRKVASFRMESSMISEQGPIRMSVDYLQPDRMRQVVTRAIAPDKPVETILVGSKAWSKDGEAKDAGWVELSPEITRQIIDSRDEVLGDDAGTIGTVGCLGSTAIDGRELIAYRIENDAQTGPVDRSPDAKVKAQKALADEARPLRMFYVDPQSGLPARSVFIRANKPEKPMFRADYTYTDIKIEPPK